MSDKKVKSYTSHNWGSVAVELEQATARTNPFMQELMSFASIAWATSQYAIFRLMSSAMRNGVKMIKFKGCPQRSRAIVTTLFLGLVLPFQVFKRDTTTRGTQFTGTAVLKRDDHTHTSLWCSTASDSILSRLRARPIASFENIFTISTARKQSIPISGHLAEVFKRGGQRLLTIRTSQHRWNLFIWSIISLATVKDSLPLITAGSTRIRETIGISCGTVKVIGCSGQKLLATSTPLVPFWWNTAGLPIFLKASLTTWIKSVFFLAITEEELKSSGERVATIATHFLLWYSVHAVTLLSLSSARGCFQHRSGKTLLPINYSINPPRKQDHISFHRNVPLLKKHDNPRHLSIYERVGK